MNTRTKSTNIKPETKKIVHERDRGRCVICGTPVPVAMACAHYIPRSKGGLGVEQNIFTACSHCHRLFDQGTGQTRASLKVIVRDYLRKMYYHFDESNLVYKKWSPDDKAE